MAFVSRILIVSSSKREAARLQACSSPSSIFEVRIFLVRCEIRYGTYSYDLNLGSLGISAFRSPIKSRLADLVCRLGPNLLTNQIPRNSSFLPFLRIRTKFGQKSAGVHVECDNIGKRKTTDCEKKFEKVLPANRRSVTSAL